MTVEILVKAITLSGKLNKEKEYLSCLKSISGRTGMTVYYSGDLKCGDIEYHSGGKLEYTVPDEIKSKIVDVIQNYLENNIESLQKQFDELGVEGTEQMNAITPDQTREKILDVIAKKGMSTKELIDVTGDNLNLYKYLRGDSHTISADRIAKIAIALGVSCDYLLTENDQPTETALDVEGGR